MNREIYRVGIDGGGTGTRAILAARDGRVLGQGSGGPAGLALGIEGAWASIETACRAAFADAGLVFDWSACALGCGLAGVNNPDWLAAFHAQAPRVAALEVESDAYTTLLGAHGGEPGVIVALGTGSIAAALDAHGVCRLSGGYGFPAGDEASGAWFGLRALAHAQQALDGRVPMDALARALLDHIGAGTRDELVIWSTAARQTAYASLAPIVFAHRTHALSAHWIAQAAADIVGMVGALDPEGRLPVALCGGLAHRLLGDVPPALQARLRKPLADSAQGALQLAQRALAQLATAIPPAR